MKLFNLDTSPYATRVRSVIRKKELDVEILEPAEALRSPEFIARFPMGKIPVLELDDGTQLPDSWVIMEYLDATCGGDSLSPRDPLEKARMQLLARCADTCLGPAGLFPLFQRLTKPGAAGDAEDDLDALDAELARLERLLNMLPAFEQRSLNLGDIALVPHIDFVLLLTPVFGRAEPLANFPRVAQWHIWALQDAAVMESSNEMTRAAQRFFPG